MTLACTGIGISGSRPIAMGEAYILLRGQVEVFPVEIAESELEIEAERFRQAVSTAQQQLRMARDRITHDTVSDIAAFVDAHLLMLEDSVISEGPIDLIRSLHCSAEWALQVRRDELARVFDEMEDPYLRTRKEDVDHVVGHIQKILLSRHGDEAMESMSLEGKVVLAPDLTPADTILMRHQGIAGFVTEFGSPMSHTAILARSLGIPAVVGVRQATQCLHHGELLVIDGENGVVLADVDETTLEQVRRTISEQRALIKELQQLVYEPSVSYDGESVTLMANIELPEDIIASRKNGAQAVGLFRTEFLYMNRERIPDEAEHLRSYREVVHGLRGLPITIRTLDLGADKQVDSPPGMQPPSVCNPALGLRAVRLCLKEPQLFRTQLRAIMRASADGPVRVMIPMVSNVRELLEVRSMVDEIRQELRRKGIPFAPNIPLGAMVEVPAAALSAAAFARHVDFLSIGTNDLIQYTLAIDRVDDEVNYLFDPLHPSVLRLIKMTIDAARAAGIPVSMCGEMAGDPRYTRLLLGMGLRELSMQPSALLRIKRIVLGSNLAELEREVAVVFQKLDEGDVDRLVDDLNARYQ